MCIGGGGGGGRGGENNAEHWHEFATEHVALDEGRNLQCVRYTTPFDML